MRKLVLFWSPYEWPDAVDYAWLRERSLPLRLAFVERAALSALAAAGLLLMRRQWRRWAPVLMMLAGWTVVTVAFFLFSRYRLMLLAIVATVLAGIWFLLHKTSFGRVVRAGIQRPDMVAALGIRLQPYMAAIVMLGVGMAALGGALFAPITVVHPAMGAEIITVAFVVVVIGGLGSFWGVVLAALLVGVVRGVTIHFAPAAGEASMYVLMFLVLLFRPRGLLGERIEKFE